VRITIVKWTSIVALLATIVFWEYVSSYQLAMNLVVSMAAGLVALQALRNSRPRWVVGFAAITLLYGICALAALMNPVAPLLRVGGPLGILLIGLTLIAFGFSLLALRSHRLLSIPSITGRTPGSQAL
jgi:hypothetical protein